MTGIETRVTQRMPLLEQGELPTLKEHPDFTPGFQCGLCYSICSFMCNVCRYLFVLFSIVFSVRRNTDSD